MGNSGVGTMDKRRYSRVPFRMTATVEAGQRLFSGDVDNVSMNGLFLKTTERLPEGQTVRIVVVLSGPDPDVTIAATGCVSRCEATGMAFRFEGVDLDSFAHLRSILEYNTGNPARVLGEIAGIATSPEA